MDIKNIFNNFKNSDFLKTKIHPIISVIIMFFAGLMAVGIISVCQSKNLKLSAALYSASLVQSYDIYVSVNGSDSNQGTLSSPVATLNKARDIIRSLPRPLSQPVNVYLRSGTYNLSETFKLDDLAKDSGENGAVITYQSYPGEKATISGGKKLSLNWTAYNQNIYSADVSNLINQYGSFNSLFVNGKRAIKSRTPNSGFYEIKKTDTDNNFAFYFQTGEINPNWRNINDVEIVASRNFIQSRFNIKKIDGTKVYLSGKSNPYYFGFGQDRYYVENVFEGLSEGEWYLDKINKKLYYWPKVGENIQNLEFIAPALKTLIEAGSYSALKEKSDMDYLEIKEIDPSGDGNLKFDKDFTISMFVNLSGQPSDGEWILSKGDEFRDVGIGIYVEPAFGYGYSYIKLGLNDGSKKGSSLGVTYDTLESEMSKKYGDWTHIAWVVDRSSKKVKSYANGIYNPGGDLDISNFGSISNIDSLIIGKLRVAGFTGDIDEFKIYNRALTNDEISKLAGNKPIGSDKLEISLSFENNLKDEGNGNFPLAYGNPVFINGKYGKALHFTKKDIYGQESFNDYLTNVNFKNLNFSYTDYRIPENGYPGFQSDYYLENTAVVLITKDSAFQNNTLSHTGEYALASYSKNLTVNNNTFNDLGAGAIRIGFIGEYWNYKLVNNIANANKILNNRIAETGKIFRASPAITVYHSSNNLISQNIIRDASYSGISLGWFTISDWDSFMSNNIVEYNNIYNVMKDLNDGGGIYLLGKQPGTIINNNIIKNVKQTASHLSSQYLFGLYFDHAEDVLAKNNLVSNIDYSGIIFFKEPKNLRAFSRNNKVENNIFVDSGKYQTFFNSREDTFTKNIVYYNDIKNPQDTQLVYNNRAGIIKSSDYNLFYTPKVVPVYRFWNKKTGNDHFYTTNEAEKSKLIKTYSNVWTPEGAAFYVHEDKAKDTVPVYRFYNNKTGGHFYTANEAEKQKLIDKYSYVWIPEGIAFYVYPSAKTGLSPVYRFYNPKTEEHFYTINEAEKNKLLSSQYKNIWTPEGIAFYAYVNAVPCSLCSMLEAWKKTGQDKNSVIANPIFEDYWAGNFNIKSGSPALKSPINFTQIDFSKVPKSQ